VARTRLEEFARTAKYGVLIGIAGGIAEVIWIVCYGSLAGGDITDVARAISATASWVLPDIPFVAMPIFSGIAIHMLASAGIGVALVFVWRGLAAYRPAWASEYVFMLGALAVVWAFNFFVVLPLISPAFVDLHRVFVELVPYPASLISKLLFGLAGAVVLRSDAGQAAPRRGVIARWAYQAR